MIQNNIAFDLDGTLVDFTGRFIDHMKRFYDTKVVVGNSFHLTTDPPISEKILVKLINETIADYPLFSYTDANYFLKQLYEVSGDPFYVITARPSHLATATLLQLNISFDVPFKFTMVNSGMEKWRYLGNFKYFCEDRRKTALDLAKRGKKIFMPDRPWNKGTEHPNIIRYQDFDDEPFNNIYAFVDEITTHNVGMKMETELKKHRMENMH